jgi:hypothetical protein
VKIADLINLPRITGVSPVPESSKITNITGLESTGTISTGGTPVI